MFVYNEFRVTGRPSGSNGTRFAFSKVTEIFMETHISEVSVCDTKRA